MQVNPKELQKFMDVWQPVIAALPTVINAVEREQELSSNVARLEAQLQKTLSDIEAAVSQKSERLALVDAEIQVLIGRKNEANQELKDTLRDTKAEIAQAKKAAAAKIKEHETAAAEAESAAAAAEKNLDLKLKAIETSFDSLRAEKQSQIDELEAKRLAAEKTLSELRSKLG